MEPLEPRIREALKLANPGLNDQDIDKMEELFGRSLSLDLEQDVDKIKQVEEELRLLLQNRAPRYREVIKAFNIAVQQEAISKRPPPTVILKSQKRP